MPLIESGHPFGPTRPSPDPLLPCVSTSPGETTGKAGGGGVGLKPVMESKPAPTWCMPWLILPHVVFGSTILFFIAVCLRYLCVFFVVVYYVHQNHRLPCVAPFPTPLPSSYRGSTCHSVLPVAFILPQISLRQSLFSWCRLPRPKLHRSSHWGFTQKTRGWVAYHVSKKHLHVRSGFHIIFIYFSFRHGGYCITGT